jgi:ketosteroid isomerase-like protein
MIKAPRLFALVWILVSVTSCASQQPITQDELVRRTQELYDSVASGDQAPWKKYFAEDATYFDEKGRNMNKAALVADVTPLPPGYSGTIKVVNPHSIISGRTAILSFDEDETETVFGRELHARYHETDTWLFRKGQWQIVAGQVLRYYEDPAPGTVNPKEFSAYVGTYELVPGNTLVISTDGQQLFRQRGDHPKEQLIPEAPGVYFRKGVEGRILFPADPKGTVSELIDRRNNEDLIWKKVNAATPAKK